MYRLLVLLICSIFVNSQTPTTPTPAVNVSKNPVASPTPPNYPAGVAAGRIPPGFPAAYYNGIGAVAPILAYSNDRSVEGTYAYSFSTGDGKQAVENGFLKDAFIDNAGEPQGTQVVEGSYSYISPEGIPIQVHYIADENGFRPSIINIPADGKAVLPDTIINKDGVTPGVYNPYNPLYRNPYSLYPGAYRGPGVFNGTYNPFLRPFDPRYPYDDGRYNAFNPYRPVTLPPQPNQPKTEKPKTEST